jgi:hypothetical protein
VVRHYLSRDKAQQRGLTGAAWPHDRRYLTLLDCQVESIKDLARPERIVEVVDLDKIIGYSVHIGFGLGGNRRRGWKTRSIAKNLAFGTNWD